MSYQVLFLCHAGKGIGLGHFSRSVVAGRALVKNFGYPVEFIVIGDGIKKKIEYKGLKIRETNDSVTDVISSIVGEKSHDLICLDLFKPLLTEPIGELLNQISSAGTKIVTIDHLMLTSTKIDLIYVPSFLPPPNLKRLATNKIVAGWDCFLLNIKTDCERKTTKPNVLVLTGGSDVTELGMKWPDLLDKGLSKNIIINWVVGPYSQKPRLPVSISRKFNKHIAPPSLTELMLHATAAATLYGVSFFELVALGIPTVVFSPYGQKDKNELSEIKRLEIAYVASNEVEATNMLAKLIKDKGERERLSSNCKNLMGNHNGKRFAHEVQTLLSSVTEAKR